jgi:hypothetical protein
MNRRRLILAACLAVFALGVAWWLYSDRLSAEEQLMVGTWHLNMQSIAMRLALEIRADRHAHLSEFIGGIGGREVASGRWTVKDGAFVFDPEPSALNRVIRPIANRVGIDVRPIEKWTIVSIAPSQLVVVRESGLAETWTTTRPPELPPAIPAPPPAA